MPLIRDLSWRARFALTGGDRVRFLHGMVTNDVERLAAGQGCHAAMLTVKGKLLCDLVIYADADRLELALDPEVREQIKQTLERHMIVDDVELADLTGEARQTGLYGDDAAAAIRERLGVDVAELPPYHHREVVHAGQPVRVARNPWLGIPGFHVVGGAPWSGSALSEQDAEVYRIEAGTPRYGVDMDEERLVLEANLTDAISFDKGCYMGQEVVARATARGHVNRKLVGLTLDGAAPAERGARVSGPERDDAGQVTSSVFSPRLGRAIALGYVHRTLFTTGTELTVHDAAGPRVARVTDLPFRG